MNKSDIFTPSAERTKTALISFTNLGSVTWEANLVYLSNHGQLVTFPHMIEVTDDWKI